MGKVTCPECGHKFQLRRSRLVLPRLAKLSVVMLGNASVSFLAAYALSTGIGELYSGGWQLSTRLAIASMAAGGGLLAGASRDTIGSIAGLRPAMQIRNKPLRTANVFASVVQSVASVVQRNAYRPPNVALARAGRTPRTPAAIIPIAVAITGNLTDAEMFRFLCRAEAAGLARAGHVPRAMTRLQYEDAIALLHYARCIIGRRGNQPGRLVDSPGRVMMHLYQTLTGVQ